MKTINLFSDSDGKFGARGETSSAGDRNHPGTERLVIFYNCYFIYLAFLHWPRM